MKNINLNHDFDHFIVGVTESGVKFEDKRFNTMFSAYYHADKMNKGEELAENSEKVATCKVVVIAKEIA